MAASSDHEVRAAVIGRFYGKEQSIGRRVLAEQYGIAGYGVLSTGIQN